MIYTETINGIRTTFDYVSSNQTITIMPEESDFKNSDTKSIILYFRAMARWVDRVRAKNPGWKIFGVTNGEEL